ncbi:MAG: hypothetical protein PF513_07855 [Tenericutes bacterium]|jgi:hypothetical protein|nr:hypothetical protein [Mycoplasmatota bacterium]
MEVNVKLSLKQIRKQRMFIITFLLFALVLTIAFGTLQDPFRYTLSNIGNRFGWGPRIIFIIWAFVSGLAIEISFIFIMKLINYNDKKCSFFIGLSSFSIILTGLIPALKNELPFWHTLHVMTSLLIAVFFLLALVPLVQYILTIIPEYRKLIYIWMSVIWAGSITLLILYNITAMFEIWFFVTIILFLIYLTFILYEKAIFDLYEKEIQLK